MPFVCKPRATAAFSRLVHPTRPPAPRSLKSLYPTADVFRIIFRKPKLLLQTPKRLQGDGAAVSAGLRDCGCRHRRGPQARNHVVSRHYRTIGAIQLKPTIRIPVIICYRSCTFCLQGCGCPLF